jgi:beta-mannosidase
VRFAAECLAFANIPDQAALDDVADGLPGGITVHHPRWKAGVPRDSGTGWDFDDVRDHYLASVFGLDPGELRRSDHDRYLELSRAVTGEVMAEVFGEWRRGGSPCAGGLVLWLRDLQAGAGWGVLDYRGRPKVAYHHLRRALAPLAVWSTDEGLSGIAVHVANDRPSALTARLRVAWAYRFGPPGQDVVVCSLERAVSENREPLSQSFRFPVGRPLARESSAHLGLEATLSEVDHDTAELLLRTRRLAYGVRIAMPGFEPADDAFCLEPGGERQITLRRISDERAAADAGTLTALNLSGRAAIVSEALL